MITFGSATVYTSFDKSAKARLPLLVQDAINALLGKCNPPKSIPHYKRFIALGVSGNDASNIDCLLPDVRYEI
jgi:hypothetical protein